MNCLQQIVESRAVGIGQTDEPARRVHPRRAGKITVGALLTKMLLSLRPGFLAQPTGMDRCREVNGSDPLVTCFAEHRAKEKGERCGGDHHPKMSAAKPPVDNPEPLAEAPRSAAFARPTGAARKPSR